MQEEFEKLVQTNGGEALLRAMLDYSYERGELGQFMDLLRASVRASVECVPCA